MHKGKFLLLSRLIIFFSFTIHIPSIGQNLAGKWNWENDQMHADVYFSGDMYYMEAYIKNSTSQISEGFSYYFVSGDTLIFNKIPRSQGREAIAYHYIESISDSAMTLVHLGNGRIDYYRRKDQNFHLLSKYRNNEFYYIENTNICISDNPDNNNNHCLNFGAISVNSTINEIEYKFGKPFDVLSRGTSVIRVYLLRTLEDGSTPYLAVELKNDSIKSIQITGDGTIENLSFSSISLGDYYTFVEQKLGKPTEIGYINEETKHWAYTPFTFSFEIKNNFVYSIKLNKQIE